MFKLYIIFDHFIYLKFHYHIIIFLSTLLIIIIRFVLGLIFFLTNRNFFINFHFTLKTYPFILLNLIRLFSNFLFLFSILNNKILKHPHHSMIYF